MKSRLFFFLNYSRMEFPVLGTQNGGYLCFVSKTNLFYIRVSTWKPDRTKTYKKSTWLLFTGENRHSADLACLKEATWATVMRLGLTKLLEILQMFSGFIKLFHKQIHEIFLLKIIVYQCRNKYQEIIQLLGIHMIKILHFLQLY